MSTSQAAALRDAIRTSIPEDLFQLVEPDPRYVYVPRAHVRALDPDNMLVVGGRGTGKSFWWNALLSERARAVIAPSVPALQRTRVIALRGWSPDNRAEFPDKDTIASLRAGGVAARTLWKTVFLAQVAPRLFEALPTWRSKVAWVDEHPEDVAHTLREEDSARIASGETALVLFDGLDRTAERWEEMRELTKGLLQVVLDLRSTRALRAKAFVRNDVLDDAQLTAFPDASKVLSGRVNLEWSHLELYALLWQYMGNADAGADVFRSLYPGWTETGGVHRMPEVLRTQEQAQRQLFASIAGNAMGPSMKYGIPYTWIQRRLADAHGVVAPRSFLTALRTAADHTATDAPRALDVQSIRAGVHRASRVRMHELREDFPWIQETMEALEGLAVPCDLDELDKRWESSAVLTKLSAQPNGRTTRRGLSKLDGLRGALLDIGVLETRPNGRFNIPDVYRIGFGMTRKGGVRATH